MDNQAPKKETFDEKRYICRRQRENAIARSIRLLSTRAERGN
jgi:hypothetical protein